MSEAIPPNAAAMMRIGRTIVSRPFGVRKNRRHVSEPLRLCAVASDMMHVADCELVQRRGHKERVNAMPFGERNGIGTPESKRGSCKRVGDHRRLRDHCHAGERQCRTARARCCSEVAPCPTTCIVTTVPINDIVRTYVSLTSP